MYSYPLQERQREITKIVSSTASSKILTNSKLSLVENNILKLNNNADKDDAKVSQTEPG